MKRYFDRAIWLHLRVPFSLFLMPVFGFALSQAEQPDWSRAAWAFFVLHFLIYPASNAYNSYFDRDEGPIGALESPPPVDERLWQVAWFLDILGLLLSFWLVSPAFAGAMFVYGLISKAYSDDRIRLKRYPIASWLVVGAFQGAFTYLAVSQAVDEVPLDQLVQTRYLFPALLTTLNLWAFYPITQVYQHEEDARRGDLTLSRLLGIRGTFWFVAGLFGVAASGFALFFFRQYLAGIPLSLLFLGFLVPGVLYFLSWFRRVWFDARSADFQSTMTLTLLGSQGLNLFFLLLLGGKFWTH
jgi:1,4-dihydroxy-2-naphthoate octaprenyltransferase